MSMVKQSSWCLRTCKGMALIVLLAPILPGSITFAQEPGAALYQSQCASCHGNDGLALATPVLHGQEPAYIVKALRAFKSGSRTDRITMSMNTIAAGLTEDQMSALAHYLAGQDPCVIRLEIDHGREGFREEFSAGRKKYIQSNCSHCHESFHHYAPRLMGQKADYLSHALKQFRSGERLAPMMPNLLHTWGEEDYRNVVTYISGMRLMRSCGPDH